jgi:hypothetical protein
MIIPVLKVIYDRVKAEEEKKVEKFDSGEEAVYLLSNLLNLTLVAVALFLCFRRNAPEVNAGAVIVAFCCPLCYILYSFAVPLGK